MADQPTVKPNRLWRILLVASLALNVAVLGLVGGALMRDKVGGRPPQGVEFGMGPLGQALSKNDRRQIGRAIRAQVDFSRGERVSPRLALRDVQVVLRSDPFDPEALSTILARTMERSQRVQGAAKDAFIEHITQMSPEERGAFADRLEEGLKRRAPKDR